MSKTLIKKTSTPKIKKAQLPFEVITYAQNREDLILFWLTGQKSKGFYVDVGASEPVDDFSVTRLFYEFGWVGINIEPINRLYQRLQKFRPKDINLRLGVANKKGELEFREYIDADGFSTFSEDNKKQVGSEYKYRDLVIQTDTLANILKDNLPPNTEIDFLKIDVEGFEYDVIVSNDWDKYRPDILCIEANHVNKDWRKIIHDAGYRLVFFDGLNEYWAENEMEVRSRFKDYAEIFLTGRVIEQQRSYDVHRQTLESLEQVEKTNAFLIAENEENMQEIDALRKDLQYLSTLNIKASLRQLIKAVYRGIRFRTLSIIWGTSGYTSSKELMAAYKQELKDKATLKYIIEAINTSDAANIKLVSQNNQLRKYIYEILRRCLIKFRKIVNKSRTREDSNA